MDRRVLEVVPYNPEWPRQFEMEQALLRAALGEVVLKVHHVGSTVPPRGIDEVGVGVRRLGDVRVRRDDRKVDLHWFP